MKTFRRGMSLFELLVVMIIVGIIYSIGMFTLKKGGITAPTLTLATLKSTLDSFEHSGSIRMICDSPCDTCRVRSADGTLLSTMNLSREGDVFRYEFDRYGTLRAMEEAVAQEDGKMEQVCFEFSLYADGTVTPLLVKNGETFYLYTPLGGETPLITRNEEVLREALFDEKHYPLTEESYYGGR